MLNIFDLYSWYVKIFSLYTKYIKHIFGHIWAYWIEKKKIDFVWFILKYTIFIKESLNYNNEVILI
jgi:hypothetical protein